MQITTHFPGRFMTTKTVSLSGSAVPPGQSVTQSKCLELCQVRQNCEKSNYTRPQKLCVLSKNRTYTCVSIAMLLAKTLTWSHCYLCLVSERTEGSRVVVANGNGHLRERWHGNGCCGEGTGIVHCNEKNLRYIIYRP